MNSSVLVKEIEQQLNSTLATFDYSFSEMEDRCRLHIGDFPEIDFPYLAGGTVVGGSAAWIKKKHADGGIHEPAMIAALLTLRHFCPQSQPQVFLDVGSLYGYFSLIFCSLFPGASAYAFEANPESFAALENNVRANQLASEKRINCVNIGLSDRTLLGHKVKIDNFRVVEEPRNNADVVLDIMELDDFCRGQDIRPTVIKIDVEGYQAKIIPGAMETIAKSKPFVLLEFDALSTMQQFGTTNKDVVEPLFGLGYSLLWCPNHRNRSVKFQALQQLSEAHEKNSLALFIPS